MSRVLYCSSLLSRSSSGLRSLNSSFDRSLRREFHFRVLLCQEEPIHSLFRTISGSRQRVNSLPANLHTSFALASSLDDPQQRQREDDDENDNFSNDRSSSQSSGQERADREPQVNREGESIVQRLRKLSMTSAREYQLSPLAEEKAREMAKVRSEVRKRGEEWKWDQRNLRPGVPPSQGKRYEEPMRNWDEDANASYNSSNRNRAKLFQDRRSYDYVDEDEEDDYFNRRSPQSRYDYQGRGDFREYSPRNSGGYSDSRDRRTQRQIREDEDGPEDYEVEMQKLRDRMEKIKEEKAKVQEAIKAKKREETEASKPKSEEGSSGTSLAAYAYYISSDEKPPPPPNSSSSKVPSSSFSSKSISSSSYLDNNFTVSESESNEDRVNLEFAGTDPDTFGNLTVGSTSVLVKDTVSQAIQQELLEDAKVFSEVQDDEEEDDSRFTPPHGERWTSQKLIKKVRKLLEEKKLKEAIDTFLNVLKEGGFNFDHDEIRFHFHVLINECAKVGYVDMAYLLVSDMKKRGYKEKLQTYSCLLNAIANSPWAKEKNLERIDKLMIMMKERGFEPNLITYHALIKAYGRLGETLRAFGVVDQMLQETKLTPNTETFNMLLQACISDKANGFRHALITWRKLQSMKYIKPDIYTFNLLLRSVRDCGIVINIDEGNLSHLSTLNDNQDSVPALPVIVTEEDSNRLLAYLVEENPTVEDSQLVLDGLGEPEIIDVKALKKALTFSENRLAVIGGIRGFLSQMTQYKVGPNLKTVSQLLECSKGTELIDVLHLLKAYKIKADVDFYNLAIARCYNKNEDKLAKEFLKMLIADNHVPNIVTYGALALGCRTWTEARKLLEDMDNTKYTPNIVIMASFLKSAMRNANPIYATYILEAIRKREITVNPEFLDKLINFKAKMQNGIINKEMGRPVEPKALAEALEKYPQVPEQFGVFKMRLKTWLETVEVKVDPENPWKEEFRHFKKERHHIDYQEEDEIDKLISEKMGIKMPKKFESVQ